MATVVYPWLNMIAAFSERDQVIGYGGDLPWPRLFKDMKRFKQLTLGQIVIMGHKTFKSLNYEGLPDRVNIVITKDEIVDKYALQNENYISCTRISIVEGSVDSILRQLFNYELAYGLELWVIGGQSIYEQFLPYTNKLYLTVIHKKFYGDRHFPVIDQSIWQLEQSEQVSDILPLTFQVWGRK